MHRSLTWFLPTLVIFLVVGCSSQDKAAETGDAGSSSERTNAHAGEEATVRIADVGAGLCCVIRMPGPKYVIYDAGNYEDSGKSAMSVIAEVIPVGSEVAMLVLSHSDSDHVASVPDICEKYRVKIAVFPDIERDTATWKNAVKALDAEVATDGCKTIRVKTESDCQNTSVTSSESEFRVLCGWAIPPANFGCKDDSELKNGGSIIARFTCGGWSVLFTGDAVGRHLNSPPGTCIAGEGWLVDNIKPADLESDVLVAPHHGADNSCSERFLGAVHPAWVIFSSGHKFSHPRAAAAERCIAAGVKKEHILRTDRGDDEGGEEWDEGRVAGTKDARGDDTITVTITKSGASWRLTVEQQK
jgi:beta-lactamase superfamily II metal-dependent hydrolase